MSHSELIKLRESLMEMLEHNPMEAVAKRYEVLDLIKLNSTVVEKETTDSLEVMLDDLLVDTAMVNKFIKIRIEKIDELLKQQTADFIRDDNVYWDQPNIKYRTAEYNRDYRKLKIFDETRALVKARIGLYTDWKYPGLEIGPGDAIWTKELVAQDPLYVVDFNNEFLETTKLAFPEGYQNRLRCYLNNGSGLHMLPQNQFGFVFSWNTFNYFSFDQISNYLKEIHKVLRPGGACMFSYNNAERVNCAKRSEEKLMTFMPETILKELVSSHGFINIKTENHDTAISWIEFRKPGELETPKAAQALGKIIFKFQLEA